MSTISSILCYDRSDQPVYEKDWTSKDKARITLFVVEVLAAITLAIVSQSLPQAMLFKQSTILWISLALGSDAVLALFIRVCEVCGSPTPPTAQLKTEFDSDIEEDEDFSASDSLAVSDSESDFEVDDSKEDEPGPALSIPQSTVDIAKRYQISEHDFKHQISTIHKPGQYNPCELKNGNYLVLAGMKSNKIKFLKFGGKIEITGSELNEAERDGKLYGGGS